MIHTLLIPLCSARYKFRHNLVLRTGASRWVYLAVTNRRVSTRWKRDSCELALKCTLHTFLSRRVDVWCYMPGETCVSVCVSVCLRVHLYGYLCRPVTGAAGRAAGRREALGPNGQLVAFRLGTNGSIIYCKRLPVVRVFLRERGAPAGRWMFSVDGGSP